MKRLKLGINFPKNYDRKKLGNSPKSQEKKTTGKRSDKLEKKEEEIVLEGLPVFQECKRRIRDGLKPKI